MRAYINLISDLIENLFIDLNIIVVHRDSNQQVDSLSIGASTFKTPIISQIKYEVELSYMPSILDNVKH